MKRITMMVLAMVAVTLVGTTAYAPKVQKVKSVWDRVYELVRPEVHVLVGPCPSWGCIAATGGFSDLVSSYKIFTLASPIFGSDDRAEVYITGPYPSDFIDENDGLAPVDAGLQVYCRIIQIDVQDPSVGEAIKPPGARTEWSLHKGSGCIPIAYEGNPQNHKFICSFRTMRGLLENLVLMPQGHRLDCIVAKNHPEITFMPHIIPPPQNFTIERAMWLTLEDRNTVLNGPHSPSLIVNDVLRNGEADNKGCPISIGQCSPR